MNWKLGIWFCSVLLMGQVARAQKSNDVLVSGPMIGHTELRTATIWAEFSPGTGPISLQYWPVEQPKEKQMVSGMPEGRYHATLTLTMVNLLPGTTYQYEISTSAKGKQLMLASGNVTTQSLWQWRKPAPDFSFLAGSCHYVNQPAFDRPGKPYGGDSSIFVPMAKESAQFMLWLGDNWYTRDVDYFSAWGLEERASHDRKPAIIQPLLKAMPNYAIWDDHDYGPNDIDKSYVFKETSRAVFAKYWANPSYGYQGEGIYSKFTWNDVDVFLMDDRTWRSNDAMEDSINGQPNPDKLMWGRQQLDWLKNALLQSQQNRNISFRIIATGSQVLNPRSPFDALRKFPVEYHELVSFLTSNKIEGVLFLTGDRHHSEIIKVDRAGTYPLYDITASPLTSGTHSFSGPEKDNPYRILGVDKVQNYAHIGVSGPRNNRTLKVDFKGVKGELINSWTIQEKELK